MSSTSAIYGGHQLNTYDSNASNLSNDADVFDDAIQKLSNSLRGAEYAIPITHGAEFIWRRCKFQSHACPAEFPRDVQYVIEKLRNEVPWSKGRYHPCAYRLSSADPMIRKIPVEGSRDGVETPQLNNLLEGCGDGGDPGAGDKLLDLLRKWDIQNVVLCVTCWDDGLRGRLGSRRFRYYLDSAKSVLEQCYLDSVSVTSSTAGSSTAGSSTAGSSTAGSSVNEIVRNSSSSGSSVSCIEYPSNRVDVINNNQGSSKVVPRGVNLHRMYQEARNRFMPVRNEFKGMSHSVVDATSQNFPSGEPDGMGNFGTKKRMGRVNHFLAVAPEKKDDYYNNQNIGPPPPLIGPPIQLPSITRNQLDEVKSIIRPHEIIHRVFQCVAMLLGYQDTSWAGIRAMISSNNFIRELVLLQPMSIPLDEIHDVRDVLTELGPKFNPGNVQRQSLLAADMLEWSIKVVKAHYASTARSRKFSLSSNNKRNRGGGQESQNDERGEMEVGDPYDEWENEKEGSQQLDNEDGNFSNSLMMKRKGEFSNDRQREDGQQNVKYFQGVPKKSLPIRVMMMDPNPDFGGQPKAKSPITVPFHMRNDVGPQPVRRNVFQAAAKDYLNNERNQESRYKKRSGSGQQTSRTDRSSMTGWNKSRGSTRASRNSRGMGSNDDVVPVNKW